MQIQSLSFNQAQNARRIVSSAGLKQEQVAPSRNAQDVSLSENCSEYAKSRFSEMKNAVQSLCKAKSKTENADEKSKLRMEQIRNKIKAGKRLTGAEKEVLRQNDELSYHKVLANEAEQKRLMERLKRCRSEKEIQAVKMSVMTSVSTAIKSIKNNPEISEETKENLIDIENQRLQLMAEAEKCVRKHQKLKDPEEEDDKQEGLGDNQVVQSVQSAIKSYLDHKSTAETGDERLEQGSKLSVMS